MFLQQYCLFVPDTFVFRRSKLQRDRERDVTEKIALGVAGGGSQSQEAMYDQRLFNQNKVSLTSCLHFME